MHILLIKIFALTLLIPSCALASDHSIGTVVRVVDGDTLYVRVKNRIEKVRLIGIDAPELKDKRSVVQCLARESRRELASRALNKKVSLDRDPVNMNRDKYGRLLRYVTLIQGDGTLAMNSLNSALIADGFAYAYTRFPFQQSTAYTQLQIDARLVGSGLWGSSICYPYP